MKWTELFVVFGSLLALLSLYVIALNLVWRVVKAAIRGLRSSAQMFGGTLSARVVGFAVATAFEPSAVYYLFVSPIRFAVRLLLSIFNAVAQLQYNLSRTTTQAQTDRVHDIISGTFQYGTGAFKDAFNDLMSSIYLIDLVYALAIWVVVGQLLSLVLGVGEGEFWDRSKNRLLSFLARIGPKTWHAVVLVVIFVSGLYLCIAAISVIPWIEESDTPQELTTPAFASMLEKVMISKEQWDTNYSASKPANQDSFKTLGELVENMQRDNTLSQDNNKKGILDGWVRQINQGVQRRQGERKELIDKWKGFREQVADEQNRLFNTTVSEYRTRSLDIRGSRERSVYVQNVSAWFRDSIIYLVARLQEALLYVQQHNDEWNSWGKAVKDRFEKAVDELRRYSPDDQQTTPPTFYAESESNQPVDLLATTELYSAGNVFELGPSYSRDVPKPPEPGVGWGPFRWVSSWLLKAQSLPLALISGMLGVGLLGASASSFVRRHALEQKDEPYQEDLVGVVIRGSSAALVIFLAVKGGLAIFSTGASKPNAYSVLLMCLVAAVFSEDAWERVKDKFTKEDDSAGKRDIAVTEVGKTETETRPEQAGNQGLTPKNSP